MTEILDAVLGLLQGIGIVVLVALAVGGALWMERDALRQRWRK